MKLNCWDHADALAMAVRLRKAGNCPREIDDLYGDIVVSMVSMATLLLVRDDPKFRGRGAELMSTDVQSLMLLYALTALDRDIDTESPRRLVNYTVKTVQNRLRNYVRDTGRRSSKAEIVTESELGVDIYEAGPRACNLAGEPVRVDRTHKVDTCDRNFN
jgi:hypothetical protein